MTAFPNKYYSGHYNITEEESNNRTPVTPVTPGTPGKQIWRTNVDSRFPLPGTAGARKIEMVAQNGAGWRQV